MLRKGGLGGWGGGGVKSQRSPISLPFGVTHDEREVIKWLMAKSVSGYIASEQMARASLRNKAPYPK